MFVFVTYTNKALQHELRVTRAPSQADMISSELCRKVIAGVLLRLRLQEKVGIIWQSIMILSSPDLRKAREVRPWAALPALTRDGVAGLKTNVRSSAICRTVAACVVAGQVVCFIGDLRGALGRCRL